MAVSDCKGVRCGEDTFGFNVGIRTSSSATRSTSAMYSSSAPNRSERSYCYDVSGDLGARCDTVRQRVLPAQFRRARRCLWRSYAHARSAPPWTR